MVGVLSNVLVLNKNDICSSDHRGILFTLKLKVRTTTSKRRIYNLKKANWDRLNHDLKSVQWDRHFKYCDTETGWYRFKKILGHNIDKYVPIITIKDSNQPPWYDSDSHHLCLKKERLRSKF